MARRYLFTSESVTEGHPDKLADRVSDAVLDAILAEDVNGRVARETLITPGPVMAAGEISTWCYVDIPTLVRNTVNEAGHTRAQLGLDRVTCGCQILVHEQL